MFLLPLEIELLSQLPTGFLLSHKKGVAVEGRCPHCGAAPPSPRDVARFEGRGERHRWMYDRVSLAELLAEAGFTDLRQTNAVDSRIPGFAAAELDADEAGRPRKPDSLYLEGVRP